MPHAVDRFHVRVPLAAASRPEVTIDVSPVSSPSRTPCAKIGLKMDQMESVTCAPGTEGRYVTITASGRQKLSLSNVMVYGESGITLIRTCLNPLATLSYSLSKFNIS